MNDKEFSVNIFTIDEGLIVMNDVSIIRIKSDKYNLMIMKDYMPIIGEVNGNISFHSATSDKEFNNVKAFYMSKKNEFNLIIRKMNND